MTELGRRRAAPPELLERRRLTEAAMSGAPAVPGVEVADVAGAPVPVVSCARKDSPALPAMLYFHGGGYRLGSPRMYRGHGGRLAAACPARVLLAGYRLAPEHPFPAALDDARAAYAWLLETGVPPGRVVLAGDSAGGGLAAALALDVAARGLPRPAGAALLSPWTDLRVTAGSYQSRAATDALFSRAAAEEAAGLYLAGHPAADPLASPLLGDWTGAAPLLVQASADEVLYDDAAGLAERARAAGVDARFTSYPGVSHVWHIGDPESPAAVAAIEEIAAFVREVT